MLVFSSLSHVGSFLLNLAVDCLVTFSPTVVAYNVTDIQGVFLLMVGLSLVFPFSTSSMVLAIIDVCS